MVFVLKGDLKDFKPRWRGALIKAKMKESFLGYEHNVYIVFDRKVSKDLIKKLEYKKGFHSMGFSSEDGETAGYTTKSFKDKWIHNHKIDIIIK